MHVRNILKKLNATNRTHAAFVANRLLGGVPIRLSAVRTRGSQEAGCRSRGVEFAPDSPLEGGGFELSVPGDGQSRSGDANFGLSQTDVAYAAFHGEGPFAAAGPDPKLRTLIALYREAFTVVAGADTGIRNFQDLRGKRVGVGTSGVGYNFTYDVVLGFYGSATSGPERVLEFSPAEQNQALCGNKVDAIIFEAGHPNGLTQEATTDCRARLVRVTGPPIDRLLATHSDYVAYVIPGGMYPGNPDGIPTIGTQAVLVTSSNQPDELCYAVVKAVIENFADFRRLHPVLSTLEIKDMVPSGSVIPIHPGALNYYREAGLSH